ncbi:MAG: helix-turn-helix domain-containing protein, partial [Myxococcota bacterium]
MRLALTACEVDLVTGDVHRGDAIERLSTRECALLRFLVEHPRENLDRDQVYAAVWGSRRTGPTRAIDTAIRRLRMRIEADPAQPAHILTIHGEGYRFEPSTEDDRAPPPEPPPSRLLLLPTATADLDRLELRRADGVVRLT